MGLKVPCRTLTRCRVYSKLCIHIESSNKSVIKKLRQIEDKSQWRPRSQIVDLDRPCALRYHTLFHSDHCFLLDTDVRLKELTILASLLLIIAYCFLTKLSALYVQVPEWLLFQLHVLVHLLSMQRLAKLSDTFEWQYWAQQAPLVEPDPWLISYFSSSFVTRFLSEGIVHTSEQGRAQFSTKNRSGF